MALLVFGLAWYFTLSVVSCEVIVVDKTGRETLATYRSVTASFGRPIPEDGLSGVLVVAEPESACSPIRPPPKVPLELSFVTTNDNNTGPVYFKDFGLPEDSLKWLVLISRYGGCTFEEKVRYAQQANYSGAIIHNVDSDKIIPMGGDDTTLIPSVFIGFQDSAELTRSYSWAVNPNVRVVLTDDEPFDINTYLLPFAIVVGICFLIMLGIVVFKCIQDHRRNRRHRLPRSALKKLPIHKFKVGDPFDTCCICLDDFEEGEKLRVLPCDHGYHSKCIDPWLVKNKRICPQCRKKVFASNERGAGLLTGQGSDSEEETTNERASLLRQQPTSYGTSAGAFGDGPSTSAGRRLLLTRHGRRNAPPVEPRARQLSSSSSDEEDVNPTRTHEQLQQASNGGLSEINEDTHDVIVEPINSVDIGDAQIFTETRQVSAEIHVQVPEVVIVATTATVSPPNILPPSHTHEAPELPENMV